MQILTLAEHFRLFLEKRPSISPDRLAGELEIDRANLNKLIKGERSIPRKRLDSFYQLMIKYGYHAVGEIFEDSGHVEDSPNEFIFEKVLVCNNQ